MVFRITAKTYPSIVVCMLTMHVKYKTSNSVCSHLQQYWRLLKFSGVGAKTVVNDCHPLYSYNGSSLLSQWHSCFSTDHRVAVKSTISINIFYDNTRGSFMVRISQKMFQYNFYQVLCSFLFAWRKGIFIFCVPSCRTLLSTTTITTIIVIIVDWDKTSAYNVI